MWLHLFGVKSIKTQYLPAKWEKNKSAESSKHIWGDVFHAAQKDSHDSIDEGDELLFLLLPLDEVSFDQRLQLRQILLHALPVDVLSQTNIVNYVIRKMSDFAAVFGRLTSKSTFSPSGILGALMLGMNLWRRKSSCWLNFTDLKERKSTYFCLGFDSSGMRNGNVICPKEKFFKINR